MNNEANRCGRVGVALQACCSARGERHVAWRKKGAEKRTSRREKLRDSCSELTPSLHPLSIPVPKRRREKMPAVVQVVARAEVATVEATAAVAAMSAKPGSVGVQRTRCSALMKLATDAAGAQAVVHTRGMTAVVAAMRLHAADVEVQRGGCGALHHLAGGDTAHKHAIVDAAGVAAVVAAMGRHTADADVQYSGCGALQHLINGDVARKQATQAILNAGGVAVVVAAMRRHALDAKLQRYGCYLLQSLAYGAGAQAIVEAGGVAAVVAAMRRHALDAKVLGGGCGALYNLACGDEMHKQEIMPCTRAKERRVAVPYQQQHSCCHQSQYRKLHTEGKGADSALGTDAHNEPGCVRVVHEGGQCAANEACADQHVVRDGFPRGADPAHAVVVQGGALPVPTPAHAIAVEVAAVAPNVSPGAVFIRIARRVQRLPIDSERGRGVAAGAQARHIV